jgi:hypothetical protein
VRAVAVRAQVLPVLPDPIEHHRLIDHRNPDPPPLPFRRPDVTASDVASISGGP